MPGGQLQAQLQEQTQFRKECSLSRYQGAGRQVKPMRLDPSRAQHTYFPLLRQSIKYISCFKRANKIMEESTPELLDYSPFNHSSEINQMEAEQIASLKEIKAQEQNNDEEKQSPRLLLEQDQRQLTSLCTEDFEDSPLQLNKGHHKVHTGKPPLMQMSASSGWRDQNSREKKYKVLVPIISIENVDFNNRKAMLNSPRTLLACKKKGIHRKELYSMTYQEVKQERLQFEGLPNDTALAHKIVMLRLEHYKKRREEKEALIRNERAQIITDLKNYVYQLEDFNTIETTFHLNQVLKKQETDDFFQKSMSRESSKSLGETKKESSNDARLRKVREKYVENCKQLEKEHQYILGQIRRKFENAERRKQEKEQSRSQYLQLQSELSQEKKNRIMLMGQKDQQKRHQKELEQKLRAKQNEEQKQLFDSAKREKRLNIKARFDIKQEEIRAVKVQEKVAERDREYQKYLDFLQGLKEKEEEKKERERINQELKVKRLQRLNKLSANRELREGEERAWCDGLMRKQQSASENLRLKREKMDEEKIIKRELANLSRKDMEESAGRVRAIKMFEFKVQLSKKFLKSKQIMEEQKEAKEKVKQYSKLVLNQFKTKSASKTPSSKNSAIFIKNLGETGSQHQNQSMQMIKEDESPERDHLFTIEASIDQGEDEMQSPPPIFNIDSKLDKRPKSTAVKKSSRSRSASRKRILDAHGQQQIRYHKHLPPRTSHFSRKAINCQNTLIKRCSSGQQTKDFTPYSDTIEFFNRSQKQMLSELNLTQQPHLQENMNPTHSSSGLPSLKSKFKVFRLETILDNKSNTPSEWHKWLKVEKKKRRKIKKVNVFDDERLIVRKNYAKELNDIYKLMFSTNPNPLDTVENTLLSVDCK